MGSNDNRSCRRGLCVIVDPEHTGGRSSEEITPGAALAGGATVIQPRDKISDKGPMLETAIKVSELCKEAGALFFMNGHADVAVLSGADGLHVGQTYLPVAAARKVLVPDQMIGASNHAMQETLAKIRGEIDGPIAAIGGINASNIGPVIAAGAEMACVISAVGMAADPEVATRGLVAIING